MKETVCHHNHCIHDIIFPTYDNTSRVYDISSPYMWHHSHYVCEYMSTIFNIKRRVLTQYNRYMWNHNLHICICVITQTVLMKKHTRYLWHGTYYIYGTICTVWHLTHDVWHHNTLSITSVYYISYQTDYISQLIHCISVITPRLLIT